VPRDKEPYQGEKLKDENGQLIELISYHTSFQNFAESQTEDIWLKSAL